MKSYWYQFVAIQTILFCWSSQALMTLYLNRTRPWPCTVSAPTAFNQEPRTMPLLQPRTTVTQPNHGTTIYQLEIDRLHFSLYTHTVYWPEGIHTLSCVNVPEFEQFVIRSTDEFITDNSQASDSFRVTNHSSLTGYTRPAWVTIQIPNLYK